MDRAAPRGEAAVRPAARSLRARLAVVLAALVALVLLANAAWLVLSARQRLRERLETSASLFASLATGPLCSAYEAYFESGYFKFRQVVRDLLTAAPDVTRVEIADVEGRILFDSGRLDEGASVARASGQLDPVRLEAARRLEPTTLRGRDAFLTVSDEGPGVPEAEREKVFGRFVRGSGSGGAEGLGLGLSLVREVVTWHRGHVSVRSAEGTGSVFEVVLPALSGEPRTKEPDSGHDPGR